MSLDVETGYTLEREDWVMSLDVKTGLRART